LRINYGLITIKKGIKYKGITN